MSAAKRAFKMIGGLWKGTSRAGQPMLTGSITFEHNGERITLELSVFENKYRTEGNNRPHYAIFIPDVEPTAADDDGEQAYEHPF